MRTLGLDPGLDGALAVFDSLRREITGVYDMPVDKLPNGRREIVEAKLANIIRAINPDHAFIELVHSMPKQGVASTFTFGTVYGCARGVLAALGVPTDRLPPQTWGRLVGLTKNSTSIIRASALFPNQAAEFTRHDRADAALIAVAGYRSITP